MLSLAGCKQQSGPKSNPQAAPSDPTSIPVSSRPLHPKDAELWNRRYFEIDAQAEPVRAWFALDSAIRLGENRPNLTASWQAIEKSLALQPEWVTLRERLSALADGPDREALYQAFPQPGELSSAFLLDALNRTLAQLRLARGTRLDPSQITKLQTRFLLTLGRANDKTAQRLLDQPGADQDPELFWLAARAKLQTGDAEGAKTALDRARSYAESRWNPPEPAPYVGSAKCRECHAEIHAQQQTSRHARTRPALDELDHFHLPMTPLPDPGDPSVSHQFRRVDPQNMLEYVSKSKNQEFRALVQYAIGSGRRGMTLLGREPDPEGTWRELRLSYYPEGPRWDRTTGHSVEAPHGPDILGRALSAAELFTCFACHSTTVRSARDGIGPETVDRGIGCERCHGPGGNHVKAAELKLVEREPALALHAGASAAEITRLCGQCHEGRSPGAAAGNLGGRTTGRFQALDLVKSRCYDPDSSAMTCVTCHDPHRNERGDTAFFESKCLQCHAPPAAENAAVPPGAPAAARTGSPCPINPRSGCISCHMPAITTGTAHTSFVDHWIRRKPELDAPDLPRADAPATPDAALKPAGPGSR